MTNRRTRLYAQAARLCLDAPQLFGAVDVPLRNVCAELMLLIALRRRRAFVLLCLDADAPLSSERIARLLSPEGAHGSDRITAPWWYGVDELCLAGAAAGGEDITLLSVQDLFGRGWMRSEIFDMWHPQQVDPLLSKRVFARQDLVAFNAKLRAHMEAGNG